MNASGCADRDVPHAVAGAPTAQIRGRRFSVGWWRNAGGWSASGALHPAADLAGVGEKMVGLSAEPRTAAGTPTQEDAARRPRSSDLTIGALAVVASNRCRVTTLSSAFVTSPTWVLLPKDIGGGSAVSVNQSAVGPAFRTRLVSELLAAYVWAFSLSMMIGAGHDFWY